MDEPKSRTSELLASRDSANVTIGSFDWNYHLRSDLDHSTIRDRSNNQQFYDQLIE